MDRVESVMGSLPFRDQPFRKSHCQYPIEHDGSDDQDADDRLLPEVLDAENRQRAVDREQQDRTDRGTVDRAAATEDGDTSDDGGTDRLQFESGSGLRVRGAVARGEQDARESGESAAEHEGDQEAALDGE